jgi:hypothetical protein
LGFLDWASWPKISTASCPAREALSRSGLTKHSFAACQIFIWRVQFKHRSNDRHQRLSALLQAGHTGSRHHKRPIGSGDPDREMTRYSRASRLGQGCLVTGLFMLAKRALGED